MTELTSRNDTYNFMFLIGKFRGSMSDITPKNITVGLASLAVAATLTTVFNIGPGTLSRTAENDCEIVEDRNPTAEEFKSCIGLD